MKSTEYAVNTMAADNLVPCIPKSSAVMMFVSHSFVFHWWITTDCSTSMANEASASAIAHPLWLSYGLSLVTILEKIARHN